MDVQQRYESLKVSQPHLLLYALVDGFVFEQLQGQALEPAEGCSALFAGTDDAALAQAGPWLIDAARHQDLCEQLRSDEASSPFVSWLISGVLFDGLVQLLQLKLDVLLPDGSVGLLRFYDPRVLYALATNLTGPQREDFFGHIHEWHFRYDGKALRIGRADA